MNNYTLVSNRKFPEEQIQKLKDAGIEYHFVDNGGVDPHGTPSDEYNIGFFELPKEIQEKVQIIVNPVYHCNQNLLDTLPNLKWIQSTGAGANTGDGLMTDWDLLNERGVTITTNKMHGEAISETIIAYMILHAKKLFGHYEAQKLRLNTGRERQLKGFMLKDRTALILGTGHIGGTTARRAKLGFDMHIIGINSNGHSEEFFDETYSLEDLDSQLPRADFVILTLTMTEKTRHCINGASIALMKADAFLINISRGDLIDEDELIDALRKQVIAGAALDVFHHEPLPKDSPLWDLDNVFITPHSSCMGLENEAGILVGKIIRNVKFLNDNRIDLMDEVANDKRY